jgi:hypothetical protein
MSRKIDWPAQVLESHIPILGNVKGYRFANLSGRNCLPCFTFENSQHDIFFMSWYSIVNKISDYELEKRSSIPGQVKVMLLPP